MAKQKIAIIGAGVGGLVAALALAREGHAVRVFEKEPQPGGKARNLMVDGVPVDGGPTVLTQRDLFEAIFDNAGAALADRVALREASVLARHAWPDGGRLDLYRDEAASAEAIAALAGRAEAEGFRAFSAEARRLYDLLETPFLSSQRSDPLTLTLRAMKVAPLGALAMRPFQSLWSALGGYFRDPRLRQLFGRYATYCGSDPFQAPATLLLIAHVEAAGVWLVDGGIATLARALAELAEENGVRIDYDTPVRRLALTRGRVAGIELADGSSLAVDRVIANTDPAALATGLLGDAVRHAARPVPPERRSLSALVWSAHARTNGFPLSRHNVFFSGDYAAEFAALRAGQAIADPTVYIHAADRGAEGGSPPSLPGRERLQIIVNAPANGDTAPWGAGARAEAEAAMRRTVDRCGLVLEEAMPAVLTTPADFAALFPATGGALYGRASHGWQASFIRQGARTRVPGLYCAGGATHPGSGVPMAARSGLLAASALLEDLSAPRVALPGLTRLAPARNPG